MEIKQFLKEIKKINPDLIVEINGNSMLIWHSKYTLRKTDGWRIGGFPTYDSDFYNKLLKDVKDFDYKGNYTKLKKFLKQNGK